MKHYQHLLTAFLGHLENYQLRQEKKNPRELYDPEAYILGLGGKRLRPLLALIGADLYGQSENALDAALAVELFHNFSLIHDDILDAAPLRRGMPAVHHKWNTNIAILSGDVMLVKAFQCLQNYPEPRFRKLSALFSQTAIEVCEGQQEDMNFENRDDVTVEEYIEMIRKKTAVLLGCSLQMGAVAAGAPQEDEKNLFHFGTRLGIAFQLMDDLLDAFPSDVQKFGKQRGGDIIANKKTFLLLKALNHEDPGLRNQAQDALRETSGSKVDKMLLVYEKMGLREACLSEVKNYTDMALLSLDAMNADQNKKEQLRQFAIGLMERQS